MNTHLFTHKHLILSLKALGTKISYTERLKEKMGKILESDSVILLNSGTTAFFILLQACQRLSKKNEVIIPAYTTPKLAMAIIKAGLKPVLCDIETNLCLDTKKLEKLISSNTLCIVAVHPCGIVYKDIDTLKSRFPGVFIIEDCAQSLGSAFKGKLTGSFGDASFFSFNVDKNITGFGAGAAVIHSSKIKDALFSSPNNTIAQRIAKIRRRNQAKILAQLLKGILTQKYPSISSCTSKSMSDYDFTVAQITEVQAALILNQLQMIERLSRRRLNAAAFLINGLVFNNALVPPEIDKDESPAFNRLPIVFKDIQKKTRTQLKLWKQGIETSNLYMKPLHLLLNNLHINESLDRSIYIAERLLTLPIHPAISKEELGTMVTATLSS